MFRLRSVSNGPDRGWNMRHGGGEVAGGLLCRPERSGRCAPADGLATFANDWQISPRRSNDCAAASVREDGPVEAADGDPKSVTKR